MYSRAASNRVGWVGSFSPAKGPFVFFPPSRPGVFVGDPWVRHRTGAGMSRLPQSAVPRKRRPYLAGFQNLLCLIYLFSPYSFWGILRLKILEYIILQSSLGNKGNDDYAAAELKKFVRTFGIVQYDQESSLKALCTRVCAELGGLSIRAAPKGRSQAQGSVGQMQRTFYGQLRAILYQIEENAGIEVSSDSCIYPWCVKHCQWLLNRFLVHSDGRTSYFRRWGRDYAGGLCCFGEHVQAKIIGPKFSRKSDTPWSTALWIGRDTEADEIIA